MGRLWGTCEHKLHLFLTALFETKEEATLNMARDAFRPLSPEVGDEAPAYERKGDSDATRSKWIDQLKPRVGRWTVHMKALGISRVFFERKEAQIFIYDTLRARDPEVSLFNDHWLWLGGKRQPGGVEDMLKVSDTEGCEATDMACCIYVAGLSIDTHVTPIGYGPLESGVPMNSIKMPCENWREIFETAWLRMEDLMKLHLKTTVLDTAVINTAVERLDQLSQDYQTTYLTELEDMCAKDEELRETLRATHALRLVYFPSYPGEGRHAFLWEKVRDRLLASMLPSKTNPITLDGWKGGEEDPADYKYDGGSKKCVAAVALMDDVFFVGYSAEEKQQLENCVAPDALGDYTWKDVLLRKHRQDQIQLSCDLCEGSWQLIVQKQVSWNTAVKNYVAHVVQEHGNWGKMLVVEDRPHWHQQASKTPFILRSKQTERHDRWVNGVRKLVKSPGESEVVFLNEQGEWEKDELQCPTQERESASDTESNTEN